MATLYLAEFAESDVNSSKEPPISEQTIAIGGSSVSCSAAFHAHTRLVRINTDAICSIAIGAAPTATATKRRMAANQTEYFSVEGGFKLAVITNT